MEFLNSFFQNVKDKITSPFFGTLTFILIIHHWEFWYTLFNFDKDCQRPEKLAILKLIGEKEFTGANLFCDVVWAIGITLVGFFVVFGTRTLSLFFDHKAMPWITGKIIDKNVVLRSVHEDVVKERDEYSDKYEEQRKNVRILSKNFDEQTLQIQEKDKLFIAETDRVNQMTEQSNYHQMLTDQLQTKLTMFENQVKTLEKKNKDDADEYKMTYKRVQELSSDAKFLEKLLLSPQNQDFWATTEKLPFSIIEKVHTIKNAGAWERVITKMSDVIVKKNISDSDIKLLVDYELVNLNTPGLTTLGVFLFNNRAKLAMI